MYVPHTNFLMLFYNEGSNQVKIVTEATFDEGFNHLPVNAIPQICQQFQQLNNNKSPPPNYTKIDYTALNFFVYPFDDK